MPRSSNLRSLLILFVVTLTLVARASLAVATAPSTNASATERTRIYVFLSAKCPCSRAHESAIRELANAYPAPKYEWIGVHANADESAAESAEHFRNANLPFSVAEDPDQRLADRFGAFKTPHVFVVRGESVLYSGGVDDSKVALNARKKYLRDALEQIAVDGKADPSETRTLGCVIARKH